MGHFFHMADMKTWETGHRDEIRKQQPVELLAARIPICFAIHCFIMFESCIVTKTLHFLLYVSGEIHCIIYVFNFEHDFSETSENSFCRKCTWCHFSLRECLKK